MKFNINITKKRFFSLFIAILVLAGAITVYAFNSNFLGGNPAVFGHSADEIFVQTSAGINLTLSEAVRTGSIGGGGPGGTTTSVTTSDRFLVESVAMSRATTCLLLKGGDVACAGYGDSGELGLGNDASNRNVFTVLPIHNVKKLYSGEQFNFCVIYDPVPGSVVNKVACWGRGDSGTLGSGDYAIHYFPTPVSLGANEQVIDISMFDGENYGYAFNCLLISDRTVKCTGRNNDYGQLGDGTQIQKNVPVLVIGLSNVQSVKVGGHNAGGYVCAIVNETSGSTTSRQGVKCWGHNGQGQLGSTADGVAHPTPQFVSGFDFINNQKIKEIVVSPNDAGTVCVILGGTADGSVQCWGYDGYGNLGRGTLSPSGWNSPGGVVGFNGASADSRAISIKMGGHVYSWACALTESKKLKCWGYNGYGQIGVGTAESAHQNPDFVLDTQGSASITGVVDYSLEGDGGYSTMCIVVQDGTVKCAGYNGVGQLGIGTTGDRNRLSTVFGIVNARAIFGGADNVPGSYGGFVSIMRDNSTRVWGAHYYGRLGIGEGTGQGGAIYVPTKPL